MSCNSLKTIETFLCYAMHSCYYKEFKMFAAFNVARSF